MTVLIWLELHQKKYIVPSTVLLNLPDGENSSDQSQGFGQYVKIIDDVSGYGYYFGHMSSIKVKVGDKVKITDIIGIEGSTGNSTGSHCHYCIRKNGKGTHIDVSEISGIPNKLGTYNDGYVSGSGNKVKTNQ